MSTIAGIILAGGRSQRMGGGDKSLRSLGGQPLLRHAVKRLAPQVGELAISANGDPRRFADYALPVLPDTIVGFVGPLAGILAGMEWAELHTDASLLVSVASDTPFFPDDLIARLAASDHGRGVAMASSGGGRHPVFSLWPLELRPALRAFLEEGATYKVSAFAQRHGLVEVDFADIALNGGMVDPFFNVNTPEDLAEAEHILEGLKR